MPTAVAFPSVEWFRQLAGHLNGQSRFRELARWTRARVGFAIGEQPTIVLTLVDGHIEAVEEGEGLEGVDYCLHGPAEGWTIFFEERGSLTQATNQLHGRLRIRGNLVAAAGDTWTLANVCRAFKAMPGGEQAS